MLATDVLHAAAVGLYFVRTALFVVLLLKAGHTWARPMRMGMTHAACVALMRRGRTWTGLAVIGVVSQSFRIPQAPDRVGAPDALGALLIAAIVVLGIDQLRSRT